MAESSIFWTTGATGDGATAYTQAQCILWLHKTFCGAANEGVNKDVDNELATTGTASPVATNTGEAYVRGFPYFNTASVDTAIPAPSGNTRIDRLVLRADWTAQTVRITRIAGTEGSGTPPALVQTDGTTWDIPLCQCSITTGGVITVTDEREFLHPNIAINTAMLDAACVTLAKMAANSVDSDQYVDGSIDLIHMSPNSVDSDQYVDGSIDTIHLGNLQVTTTKIADANVTLAKLAANSVDSDQYVDGSIDTAHLGNLQVTSGKLAADAVIAGKIADGAVDVTAALANNIVDDTKAGNRVPQFYRRQGGSATDWNTQGTTTYTPGAVRMQGGVRRWTGGAAPSGNVVVTFPTAFSYKPIVLVNLADATSQKIDTSVLITASQVTIYWAADASHTQIDFTWLAIGPE